MSRLLIICCLSLFALSACKKANGDVAQIKEQAAKDDQLLRDYIAQNGLSGVAKQVKPLGSNVDTIGVWYIVSNPGTGSNVIANSSLITVGYTGKILTTGTVFASTDTFHPAYTLGNLIKGWQLGLTYSGVKKGGKVRLLMASRYGYGPYDQPNLNLPANSVLDFDIDIFDITN